MQLRVDDRVRFRPIMAVIGHPLEQLLHEVHTEAGRTLRVTASHSVFVQEDGSLRRKRGAELRPGDRVCYVARPVAVKRAARCTGLGSSWAA